MNSNAFPPSSAPAYEMFRYPPGGKGERSPRLRYGRDAQKLWHQVRPELQRVPFEASAEEILSRRLDIGTADGIWEFQIRDFAQLVQGRVEIHGPERLLEPFNGQFLRPKPDLLHQALALASGEARVYEISLPYANVGFGRPTHKGQYSNLRHLLGEMEDVFGKQMQLQLVQNGRLRIRLPNFALWEGLLMARFGAAAHRPVFVDGIIPRDAVMRLRGKILAPVGLAAQPAYLTELNGSVHPFFIAFHDFYHATFASMLPVELCRFASALYFPLQAGLPSSGIKQEHLNRLADLDPGSDFNGNPEAFVKFTMLPFWNSFFQHVEAETMTHRRLDQYPQFLRHYRRLLDSEAATPGVDPLWRASFRLRLDNIQSELTRLLTSVLRN